MRGRRPSSSTVMRTADVRYNLSQGDNYRGMTDIQCSPIYTYVALNDKNIEGWKVLTTFRLYM